MCQVDRSDLEDKTVVEEFRKGYLLADKVLRPSLVSVSKRVSVGAETEASVQNSKKSEEE
jgi:molecular chaperone GrpE